MKQWGARSLRVGVLAAATAVVLGWGVARHDLRTAGSAFAQQLAGAHVAGSSPSSQPDGAKLAAITVDYPEQGSIFPPRSPPPHSCGVMLRTAPQCGRSMWRSPTARPGFGRNRRGSGLRIGEIDPRCVSANNALPKLTPQQAAARTWIPDAATWETIKRHSTRASRHHHDHRIPKRSIWTIPFPAARW